MMGYNIEFYPYYTYLKYKYIFFFISISGQIRSRIRSRNFFQLSRIRRKKMSDPHPWNKHNTYIDPFIKNTDPDQSGENAKTFRSIFRVSMHHQNE